MRWFHLFELVGKLTLLVAVGFQLMFVTKISEAHNELAERTKNITSFHQVGALQRIEDELNLIRTDVTAAWATSVLTVLRESKTIPKTGLQTAETAWSEMLAIRKEIMGKSTELRGNIGEISSRVDEAVEGNKGALNELSLWRDNSNKWFVLLFLVGSIMVLQARVGEIRYEAANAKKNSN